MCRSNLDSFEQFAHLPCGKLWNLLYSENYHISQDIDSAFVADISLQPIKSRAMVVLKNVFFGTNEVNLKPGSLVELDQVISLLQDNPEVKILIKGHTDNVGKPDENLKLSQGRALSVINYLVSKGIARDRLGHKGFGATKPIASNDTEEGRAKNRRTELEVQ